jgi:oxygen-independent coproporphyrinogen-3 oxidase
MAGIYIHIPFCRQACHYCDFHFSVNLETKEKMVDAIIAEIEMRKNYLDNEVIHTIYFGGGSPSLLEKNHLDKIFDALHSMYQIDADAEITLEANPDDLTPEKIAALKGTPVNRLSIGIQSFYDSDLRWMNRLHTAEQAITSVKAAQQEGFNNISIDLIYGLPELTNQQWDDNLSKAFNLNIQHLSCYSLTVEPKTALASFIKKGISKNISEESAATQFEMLMARIKKEGWQHYEISNFCREGLHSRHNSSYWKGEKYLGIGPSAHSFNGSSRQWNIANNHQYLSGIEKGISPFEHEILSPVQRINEYIMTSLRTMWGLDLKKVYSGYGENYIAPLIATGNKLKENGWLNLEDDKLILTDSGKLVADRIVLELMFN